MTQSRLMEPYLYLLIRNDLDSLNPGKAVAHGAHAANQFTHEMDEYLSANLNTECSSTVSDIMLDRMYQTWKKSANGFGTTIALSVNYRELTTAVQIAKTFSTLRAGETVDPTYPYILHKEYADLIRHTDEYPPSPLSNGMMMCLREEVTAAYIFGDKSETKMIVGNFSLMP